MDQNLTKSDSEIIKQSIIQIRNLRKQVNDLKSEPIAIVGVGCNFPGAETPEDFWDLLSSGGDATCSPPNTRWEFTDLCGIDYDKDIFHGGYLQKDITQFDPLSFNIPPREAKYIDPQHRLFLEVIWQALHNANISPKSLEGSLTGVFCGITSNEYSQLMFNELSQEEMNVYMTTGNCLNFIVGRVSYILGLKGPAMALDTACSSSLVSVHSACQSLRMKECNIAIAGGVNLMLTPQTTLTLIQGNMLSPDGKCRTFADDANGYARGEGCGVIIMKRLSDALESNDHVLAIIKNSSVRHDGKKSGLTVPISSSQKELILDTLEKADLKPEDICYVEAHGTGTPLGDPIELEALNSVYAKMRNINDPLYIGSVKTNIGHLESASGIAGLIKVVLSLYNDKLPPHINCTKLNQNFNWDKSKLQIVKENMDWPANKKRIAAVSSFGASGINAHVILEQVATKGSGKKESSEIPSYTFNKQCYWYKEIKKGVINSTKKSVDKKNNAVNKFDFKEAAYSFSLHIDSVPTIRDHRIFNNVMLTGSIYLDTALSVTQEMLGDKSIANVCIKNALIIRSIVFANEYVDLKVTVERIDTIDKNIYRVKMFPAKTNNYSIDEMYSSIDIEKTISGKSVIADEGYIDKLIKECSEEISGKDFYKNYWGHNFTIGKTLQYFKTVWRNDFNISIAYSKPLEFIKKTNAYGLNPDNLIAYLNSYLVRGTIPAKIVDEIDKKNQTFIGNGYDSCIFYDTLLQEEIYSYAQITYSSNDYSQFKGDINIYNIKGNLLCKISEVTFSLVSKDAFPSIPEPEIEKVHTPTIKNLNNSSIDHPFMGSKYSKLNKWCFQSDLDYDTYPLIGDHQTFNFALLPAICLIDLAMITMRQVKKDYKFTKIENLKIIQPIMLHKGDKYRIKASLQKNDENNYSYEIYSFSSKKNIINKEWVLNTDAVFTNECQIAKSNLVFDKKIIELFDEVYNQKEFYKKFWGEEFILGSSYYFLERVWRKPFEALAVIKDADFSEYASMTGIRNVPSNFVQIYMHLVIATAVIPDEHIEKVRANDATCISAQIQNFIIYDDNNSNAYKELWAHAKLVNKDDINDKWISDFDYYNEEGVLVARAEGVEFQIMQKKALELIKKSMDDTAANKLDKTINLKEFLNKSVNKIVGVDIESLDKKTELGLLMDSIMQLELRNEIETNLSILLPLNEMIELKSVEHLYSIVKTKSNGLLN